MEQGKRQKALEKLESKLTETFVDEVKTASEQRLRDLVVQLSKEIEEIEDHKESDPELKSLKEQLKELSAPYRDAKANKRNGLKYVLLVLEERGKI